MATGTRTLTKADFLFVPSDDAAKIDASYVFLNDNRFHIQVATPMEGGWPTEYVVDEIQSDGTVRNHGSLTTLEAAIVRVSVLHDRIQRMVRAVMNRKIEILTYPED